jgi:ABC-type transporter MlaC component
MKTYTSAFVFALLLMIARNAFAGVNDDPSASLQMTLNKISAFHNTKHHSNVFALRHFIEQDIMPRFSFRQMTRWVAGPYARYMTVNEKAAFASQLRTDFLSMLTEHLGNFNPDSHLILIGKTRHIQPDQATVEVHVSSRQQQPITLSFRMQQIQHLWKIVDIRSNGISLVMFYRARYISQLRGYQHLTQ